MRWQTQSATTVDLAFAGDAAAAAAEVLTAASRLIEGETGGPLTRAAREYDRSARETRARVPASTSSGAALRAAALQLARGSPARPSEAALVLMLIAQIGSLAHAVAALREEQGRFVQASAARRAVPDFLIAAYTSRASMVREGRCPRPRKPTQLAVSPGTAERRSH